MSYFYKKKRSEEVQACASKIAELTGCQVIHCAKSTGSMRFYFSVILQKPEGEWEKDFCEYHHPEKHELESGELYSYEWDGKAFQWLRPLGLNPAFVPEFCLGKGGVGYRYDRIFTYLHWKDIQRMGLTIPEVRTASEIRKGLTLEQLDRRH